MLPTERAQQIVGRMRAAKENFGASYPKKFGGAAAVEILRDELRREGILTSRRDVFVKGFAAEIDLLVPKPGAGPWLELLYEPREVAVALEVKKTGSFGESGRDKIKDDFGRLRQLGVACAYITFEDRESYCWRPTADFLGVPCFALAWHRASGGPLLPVGDEEGWEGFLQFIRAALADAHP